MASFQINPLQQLGQFFGGLAQHVQEHPLAQQLNSNFKAKQNLGFCTSSCTPPPKMIILPRQSAFAAILPGDSLAEQVLSTGMLNFLNLYNSALIIRLVLTWFPNPPQALVGPLATVCDPYLNLFRGLIPPLGGTLDFSPILAFVVLNFFTSTAAALPCEIGADGKPVVQKQAHTRFDFWQPLSKSQQTWAKRVAAAKQQDQ